MITMESSQLMAKPAGVHDIGTVTPQEGEWPSATSGERMPVGAEDTRVEIPMAEHKFFMAKRDRRIAALEASMTDLRTRLTERDASALKAIRNRV